MQVASQSPVVAGPKATSGHWFLHDDVGAGMIWTVRPIPAHACGCGLQPIARRSWGGPFGPAGESRPRRTPPDHDKGI